MFSWKINSLKERSVIGCVAPRSVVMKPIICTAQVSEETSLIYRVFLNNILHLRSHNRKARTNPMFVPYSTWSCFQYQYAFSINLHIIIGKYAIHPARNVKVGRDEPIA